MGGGGALPFCHLSQPPDTSVGKKKLWFFGVFRRLALFECMRLAAFFFFFAFRRITTSLNGTSMIKKQYKVVAVVMVTVYSCSVRWKVRCFQGKGMDWDNASIVYTIRHWGCTPPRFVFNNKKTKARIKSYMTYDRRLWQVSGVKRMRKKKPKQNASTSVGIQYSVFCRT